MLSFFVLTLNCIILEGSNQEVNLYLSKETVMDDKAVYWDKICR